VGITTLHYIPKGLHKLAASGCKNLIFIPPLSKRLDTLWIDSCTSLTTIPQFNKHLFSLNCNKCTSLIHIPSLPNSISRFRCSGCTNLLTISTPNVTRMHMFDISGCSSLVFIAKIPRSDNFEKGGCNFLLSKQIDSDQFIVNKKRHISLLKLINYIEDQEYNSWVTLCSGLYYRNIETPVGVFPMEIMLLIKKYINVYNRDIILEKYKDKISEHEANPSMFWNLFQHKVNGIQWWSGKVC
jgi:hypothetical protein